MALVDTSALIDLGNAHKKVSDALLKAEDRGERLLVSSLSIYELSAGYPSGLSENRKVLLTPFKIISFSDVHAEKAGMLFRKLREEGHEIGALDCMIAAVAICENEELITANGKHFSRISGLRLLSY